MRSAVRLLYFAFGLALTTAASADTQVNQPAPRVDTELLGGTLLTANELEGKVVLTVFWATWCPTCVKEMPELQRLYTDYQRKGVEILALSLDEDPADVAKFWQRKGYTFRVAMRSEGLKQAWGPVPATPQMILIDRKGVVRVKHLGAIGFEQLESEIKPLL